MTPEYQPKNDLEVDPNQVLGLPKTTQFPDVEAARMYLISEIESLEGIDAEKKALFMQAINTLSNTSGEVVVKPSIASKLRRFFGKDGDYKLRWYSGGWKTIQDIDGYLLDNSNTYITHDWLPISRFVGYGPEQVVEEVTREVIEQKRFFGVFRRNVLRTEKVQATRDSRPDEQTEEVYEEIARLFIDQPRDENIRNTHIFDKVNRNSYWIIVAENKEYAEEVKELASSLLQLFPEITIEVQLNYKSKSIEE